MNKTHFTAHADLAASRLQSALFAHYLVRKEDPWEMEVLETKLARQIALEIAVFQFGTISESLVGPSAGLNVNTMLQLFVEDFRNMLEECSLLDDSPEDADLYVNDLSPDVEDILRAFEVEVRLSTFDWLSSNSFDGSPESAYQIATALSGSPLPIAAINLESLPSPHS